MKLKTFKANDSYITHKGLYLSHLTFFVIPKRHVKSYFDLTQDEIVDLWSMVNDVKEALNYMYEPDGYNIGINIGEAAGQTIPHCHIHVIPRYNGDVEDPLGGVRSVIPEKRIYINDKQ